MAVFGISSMLMRFVGVCDDLWLFWLFAEKKIFWSYKTRHQGGVLKISEFWHSVDCVASGCHIEIQTLVLKMLLRSLIFFVMVPRFCS